MNGHVLNLIAKQTWKKLAEMAANNRFGAAAVIMTVKEIAKNLGINITKRVSMAALPVIGAAVSAGANIWFLNDVGVAAQRLYQARWLKERGLWLEAQDRRLSSIKSDIEMRLVVNGSFRRLKHNIFDARKFKDEHYGG